VQLPHQKIKQKRCVADALQLVAVRCVQQRRSGCSRLHIPLPRPPPVAIASAVISLSGQKDRVSDTQLVGSSTHGMCLPETRHARIVWANQPVSPAMTTVYTLKMS
jgi:hypothetical protein